MMTQNKYFRQLLFFILSLGLVISTSVVSAKESVSEPAPDFTLKSNSGENLRLAEFRGEVVMLNFWASWCAPCRQEMPHLKALHSNFSPLGFQLFGINVDEDMSDAQQAIEQLQIDFPVLFDNDNAIAELFDVAAMPTTIIIDRDGNIRHLHRGYKPGYEKAYADQVSQLVKEF